MEQPPQSESGKGPSLPAPAEMQIPLTPSAPEQHPVLATIADKVPAATPQPITTAHARFSDEVHSYIREYIRNADQKATFFFAALTAILAFLNAQKVPSRWLKDVRLWSFVDALGFLSMLGLAAGAVALLNAQKVPSRWLKDVRLWSFVDALGFLSMLGLAAGAVALLVVVFPRLK